MTIRQIKPPEGLMRALEKRRLNYTNAEQLMHLLWLDGKTCVGVFGDPDNGSYEWFVWNDSVLRHSDVGFGSPEFALLEVMNAEMAVTK